MIILYLYEKITSQIYKRIAKFFLKVIEQLSPTSFHYLLGYKYYFTNSTYKLMYLTRKVNVTTEEMPWGT